jgi:hypothetical protein
MLTEDKKKDDRSIWGQEKVPQKSLLANSYLSRQKLKKQILQAHQINVKGWPRVLKERCSKKLIVNYETFSTLINNLASLFIQ